MHRLFLFVSAALVVSSSAFAMDLVCSNGFIVVRCADGHQIQCGSGASQFDCPDSPAHIAIYEASCADHGGFADLGYGDEVCVLVELDVAEPEPPAEPGHGLATGKR